MLNRKIIIDNAVSPSWLRGHLLSPSHGNYACKKLDDLQKVLCHLLGYNFKEHPSFYAFCDSLGGLERNKWYDWSVFQIKVFKKGTMHLIFKNESDWTALNTTYGKIKGFQVPESCNPSNVKDMSKKDNSRTEKPKSKKHASKIVSIEEGHDLFSQYFNKTA